MAEYLPARVDGSAALETTALGAAHRAGLARRQTSSRGQAQHRFLPTMQETERAHRYRGWREAVNRTLGRPAA
ncbi:MAG TPA: hypothetical protein VE650_03365 [Acetobacteraceae bacterium]|nr:hypothetical protein [Acetobacteraceae bacterium]